MKPPRVVSHLGLWADLEVGQVLASCGIEIWNNMYGWMLLDWYQVHLREYISNELSLYIKYCNDGPLLYFGHRGIDPLPICVIILLVDMLQLHMSSLVHFGELPILNVLKWNNQWEQSVAPMKGMNYKDKARTIRVGTY